MNRENIKNNRGEFKMMTITELARKFHVTTRTLRYYEEIGILTPSRATKRQRIYDKKDIVRLQLILRGKKFGFTLEEIKEMIMLFNEDKTGVRQLEKTIEYGREKVKEVEERIQELEALKEDMVDYLKQFENQLRELKEVNK